MLWIFNGSVEPTQPGMIPGLCLRSGQGGRSIQSLAVLGKKECI